MNIVGDIMAYTAGVYLYLCQLLVIFCSPSNEPIVLVCYTRQQDGRTYLLLKLLINLIIDENVFLSANDETEVQLSCVGD